MPTNIQNVSFMSPQALLAPDLSVEQQQVQRQMNLAAALREQAMGSIDNPGGGNISWTQGAAKLAQALAGMVVQKRADKKQMGLNQQFAGRMGSMFGQTGGGGQASGGGPPPPSSIAPPAPTINVPDSPSAGPSGAPVNASPTMPQQGQPDTLAAQPGPMAADGSAQAPPPSGNPQQGTYHRGPWSMTDDPQADIAKMMGDQGEYFKQLIANSAKGAAPTDVEIMQQHLVQAAQRGDMGAVQAISQALQKLNRMPIESIRTNSIGFDPNTGQYHYVPKIGEGQAPTLDANGNVTGVGVIPGAAESATTIAQAEAKGKASYAPTQVLGSDGNYHTTPLTQVPGFGNGQQPPPAQGGGLNGFYNRPASGGNTSPTSAGNVSAPGPRVQSAETAAGTQSATAFDAATKEAAGARNTQMLTNQMIDEINGMGGKDALPTGAGAMSIAHGQSIANTVAGSLGFKLPFNADKISRFNELNKNTAQLGLQLAGQASGQAGATDARLLTALAALPGAGYTKAANEHVRTVINSLAEGAFQHAQAKMQWAKQGGQTDNIGFEQQWQQAYNPDIFYHMQQGDLAAWQKSMSPTALNRVMNQARQMKALGAFQ
jgi:hypothetical protein